MTTLLVTVVVSTPDTAEAILAKEGNTVISNLDSLDGTVDYPHFVTCPHCHEHYWQEDGHPEGTFCPVFGINAQKRQEKLPGSKGFYTCTRHGTRYWHEDGCPDCWCEVERQQD